MAQSYFSHDSNARNSDELIKVRMVHGAAGYGVYFMILERLREAENYTAAKDYKVISFELREDEELIRSIVEDFDLFIVEEEVFYSKGFLKRMKIKDDITEKRKEAGRKGGLKTQGETDKSSKKITTDKAPLKQNESNAKAIKVNKSKVNESKEKAAAREENQNLNAITPMLRAFLHDMLWTSGPQSVSLLAETIDGDVPEGRTISPSKLSAYLNEHRSRPAGKRIRSLGAFAALLKADTDIFTEPIPKPPPPPCLNPKCENGIVFVRDSEGMARAEPCPNCEQGRKNQQKLKEKK